jgi:hypothetical protein
LVVVFLIIFTDDVQAAVVQSAVIASLAKLLESGDDEKVAAAPKTLGTLVGDGASFVNLSCPC